MSTYRQTQCAGEGIPFLVEHFKWDNRVKQWIGSFGTRYKTVKDMKKEGYRVVRLK